MAIKMVREPSETPNIRNIDDIIGLRYAYGNQNGYVIDRGNEISYTINGSNFTINSGRIVIQGVECDIDAGGVTIQVDNVSALEYYTIYCEVNLATNTSNILSVKDTTNYPVIDEGDDLTKINTGTARIPLYQLQVLNGLISNVQKVVKPIDYTKDLTVHNAENVNNLNIVRDDKGVLKIGDIIIPQKKLIWEGSLLIQSDSSLGPNISNNFYDNVTDNMTALEFYFKIHNLNNNYYGTMVQKCSIYKTSTKNIFIVAKIPFNAPVQKTTAGDIDIIEYYFEQYGNFSKIKASKVTKNNVATVIDKEIYLTKVYGIIE